MWACSLVTLRDCRGARWGLVLPVVVVRVGERCLGPWVLGSNWGIVSGVMGGGGRCVVVGDYFVFGSSDKGPWLPDDWE